MLRITQSKSVMLAIVDLDGKLVGPWVDEVRTIVAALRTDKAVCLNLQHLSFADAQGLSLLYALRLDGVRLVSASPLIDGMLELHRNQTTQALPACERG